MIKTILNMLVGALIAAAVSTAFAVIGTPPIPSNGFGMVDGAWLNGLAGGSNMTFQSGIVAHAGGGQTACFQLQPGIAFYSVDTVATNADSVCLPFAQAGMDIQVANNSAATLNVYGQSANNPITAAADTLNGVAGSTAIAPTTQQSIECFSAKNGAWRCGRSGS